MAFIAGDDLRFRIALAEYQRLAAGCSAAVENLVTPRYKLCNELGALILDAHASIAKCGCAGYVTFDDAARTGEKLARSEFDAFGRELPLNIITVQAHGRLGLLLTVAANCAGSLFAIRIGPSLDHPIWISGFTVLWMPSLFMLLTRGGKLP